MIHDKAVGLAQGMRLICCDKLTLEMQYALKEGIVELMFKLDYQQVQS